MAAKSRKPTRTDLKAKPVKGKRRKVLVGAEQAQRQQADQLLQWALIIPTGIDRDDWEDPQAKVEFIKALRLAAIAGSAGGQYLLWSRLIEQNAAHHGLEIELWEKRWKLAPREELDRLPKDWHELSPDERQVILKLAATLGHNEAKLRVAYSLATSDPAPVGSVPLFHALVDSATAGGLASTWLAISSLYVAGRGCDPSDAKAFRCIERAAANGMPRALAELGGCYLTGRGVAPDREWAEAAFLAAGNEQAAVYTLQHVFQHRGDEITLDGELPWWIEWWNNPDHPRRKLTTKKSNEAKVAKLVAEFQRLSGPEKAAASKLLFGDEDFSPELRKHAVKSQSDSPTGVQSTAAKVSSTEIAQADFSNAALVVQRVRKFVDDLLTPRTVLLPQVATINQFISRLNESGTVFESVEAKRELVDSLNQAKEFLQLRFTLTQKIGKLKKGTEVWLGVEGSSSNLPTGRFIFHHAPKSSGINLSARSAHKLPISLGK